jgi:hypothetical protein
MQKAKLNGGKINQIELAQNFEIFMLKREKTLTKHKKRGHNWEFNFRETGT